MVIIKTATIDFQIGLVSIFIFFLPRKKSFFLQITSDEGRRMYLPKQCYEKLVKKEVIPFSKQYLVRQ